MKKNTKRALLGSVIAVILCCAMLIGTTFAWFTDTASTAVNKIQAGTLDVQLLDASGNSIEGGTLTWKTEDNRSQDKILWEPGATYELNSFKIKNNGNLALKYQISITGIAGAAELNNAIEWTYQEGDTSPTDLSEEGHLTANAETGLITISGHMKEEAGNEYQGKTIEDIAITVVATQDTVEYDSNDNLYDENAAYPVANQAEFEDALTNAQSGDVVNLASGKFILPEVALPEGSAISGNGIDKTTVVTGTDGYEINNDNVTISNLTVDGTAASDVDYAGALNLKGNNNAIENAVINGGGTGTWGASVAVSLGEGETAYIRNTNISGGFRGIFLGSQSGSVVVDACEIDAVYPISVDGGGNFTVTVNNSKLHGWTSYGTITSATFNNTEFSKGNSGYDVLAAYTDTILNGCTFDSEFKVYAQKEGFTFLFIDCVMNGVPVTAENFKELFPEDSDVWTKCDCFVNGIQVSA